MINADSNDYLEHKIESGGSRWKSRGGGGASASASTSASRQNNAPRTARNFPTGSSNSANMQQHYSALYNRSPKGANGPPNAFTAPLPPPPPSASPPGGRASANANAPAADFSIPLKDSNAPGDGLEGGDLATGSGPSAAARVASRNLLTEDEISHTLKSIEEEKVSTKEQLEQVRQTLRERNDQAKKVMLDSYARDNAAKLRTLPPQFQSICQSSLDECKAEVEALWAEEELRLLVWLEELVDERAHLKQKDLHTNVQTSKDIVEALKVPSQEQTDKFRQLTDKLLESESQRADIVVELGQAQRTSQDLRRLLTTKGADEVRQAHEIVARMERDLDASKDERKSLAKKIAELQSQNAILIAEKSQWLEQVQDENQQLQTLFKEARQAKEVMVRELNLIDRERREIENERHRLRTNATQKVNRGQFAEMDQRAFKSAGRVHKKITKVREELNLRQQAMQDSFDAGKALLEKVFYQDMSGEEGEVSFDRLYRRLVPMALETDESLVEAAKKENLVFKGKFPAVNTKVDSIAVAFEERLKTQRVHLQENIGRLESKWSQMWRPDQGADDLKRGEERLMNEADQLIPRSLAAGGSSQNAGIAALENPAGAAAGPGAGPGALALRAENNKLKNALEQLTGDLDRLRGVHRALHNSHLQLKKQLKAGSGQPPPPPPE